MTSREQSQLQRAVERCIDEHVTVVVRGRVKATGQRYWGVSSASHPGKLYCVQLIDNRLQCECRAAEKGLYCKHRAAVHLLLLNERAEERAQQKAEAAKREQALPFVDNTPFSIFKSEC